MKAVIFAYCTLIALAVVPSANADVVVPVEAFAEMPTFTDLAISPNGQYFAARMFRETQYAVSIFEIEDSSMRFVYGFKEDEALSISWFKWVSGDQLLASAAFTAERGDLRRVKTEERRLLVIDASTTEITPVFRRRRGSDPVQIQDRIVSFLPNEPNQILLQYSASDPRSPNVYRVDVTQPKRHTRVQRGRVGVSRWMADADGDVRLGAGVRRDTHPYLIIRGKGSKEWKEFSHRKRQDGSTFEPLGFSNNPDEIYVRSNHDGDPLALYTFDLAADQFKDLVYQHEFADVSSVNIDQKNGELLSVNFVGDVIKTVRFQERPIRDGIRRLHEQFSEQKVSTRSISDDGNHAVLRISDEQSAGNFVLFDGTDNSAIALPPQYPDLVDVPMGQTLATEYIARDGLMIPAYITLPAQYDSLDDIHNLPFVIHPHGGPGARDFVGFNFDVQFFVSRGYGVLQMNFRGSTGYGQAFKDAGSREWGQAMQDDITDGVDWLIEKGYADGERIAIVGGSYGGYAALMGAVKTPDLYQCAVSFAGVTDLPDLMATASRFMGGKYATRFVGDRWKDRKMLAHNSPARRASEVEIPILLIHGDEDTVVTVDQSEKMAKQLERHDKDYKLVVLANGDHHHSLYENRLLYLQEMDAFLGKCLQ